MKEPSFLPVDHREPTEEGEPEMEYEEEIDDPAMETRHKYSKMSGPYAAS